MNDQDLIERVFSRPLVVTTEQVRTVELMRPEPPRKVKRQKVNRWRTRGPEADVKIRKVPPVPCEGHRSTISLQDNPALRGTEE